jgi:hypothetical protein
MTTSVVGSATQNLAGDKERPPKERYRELELYAMAMYGPLTPSGWNLVERGSAWGDNYAATWVASPDGSAPAP